MGWGDRTLLSEGQSKGTGWVGSGGRRPWGHTAEPLPALGEQKGCRGGPLFSVPQLCRGWEAPLAHVSQQSHRLACHESHSRIPVTPLQGQDQAIRFPRPCLVWQTQVCESCSTGQLGMRPPPGPGSGLHRVGPFSVHSLGPASPGTGARSGEQPWGRRGSRDEGKGRVHLWGCPTKDHRCSHFVLSVLEAGVPDPGTGGAPVSSHTRPCVCVS